MKLFLIDDDTIQNHLVKMTIKKIDREIDLTFFSNPILALDFLSKISDIDSNPDIILLDLNMPELSGWQFLEQYAKFPITSKVAILSSTIDANDVEKSKTIPLVFHFCHKPLTPEKLIEILEKVNSIV